MDYIWFDPERVQVLGVSEMLKGEPLLQSGGLPTRHWSSDHMSLVAQFTLLRETDSTRAEGKEGTQGTQEGERGERGRGHAEDDLCERIDKSRHRRMFVGGKGGTGRKGGKGRKGGGGGGYGGGYGGGGKGYSNDRNFRGGKGGKGGKGSGKGGGKGRGAHEGRGQPQRAFVAAAGDFPSLG